MKVFFLGFKEDVIYLFQIKLLHYLPKIILQQMGHLYLEKIWKRSLVTFYLILDRMVTGCLKRIEKINICIKLTKLLLVTNENMGLCLYILKTMSTHSKAANEQTLKTESHLWVPND